MDKEKNTLIYDVSCVPYETNMQDIIYLFKEHRIVIYDGTKVRQGFEPRIENGDGDVKFYDSTVDTKDFVKAMKILNKEVRD